MYKIGRSSQEPMNYVKRLKDYPKGSKICFVHIVPDDSVQQIESDIISTLNRSFKCVHGKEYFQGDEKAILEVLSAKFYELYSRADTKCDDCVLDVATLRGTKRVQQNNKINTYIQHDANNIMTFPVFETDDDIFEFVTDHITLANLQDCIVQSEPQNGFNHFILHVLKNPRNRNVQKRSMKEKYSKVHIGNNRWELALDIDVYPTLIRYMATGALDKMEEHRNNIPESIHANAQELIKFIDYINAIEEGDVYKDTVKRLKLAIVNLCNAKTRNVL